MKTFFAPGCALNSYKPHLVSRMARFLEEASVTEGLYLTCCKAAQTISGPVRLIVCCPGCLKKKPAGCTRPGTEEKNHDTRQDFKVASV